MNKPKILIPLFVLAIFAAGAAGYYFAAGGAESGQSMAGMANMQNMSGKSAGKRRKKQRKILYYRSPMDPGVTSDHPKKDAMGMAYIPVYAGENAGAATVEISPNIMNNLGVRTATVRRGTLPRIIRTVGYVSYDKALTTHVHVRASGWITKAPIKSTGERLQKGDPLFTLYSPDLVTAEQEYVTALGSGNKRLIQASRERLVALGISDEQIARIKRTRKPIRYLQFRAPHDGLVDKLNVREGQYVTPSTELMQLGSLSRVWVVVNVFEQQANWVRVGDPARIELPSLPGQTLKGKVQFVYPSLDPATRTLRVRLAFDNPGLKLKPNMYVDARVLSAPEQNALYVPREALIREGDGAHVIVALGGGRFAPRDVTLGIESGNRVQILKGLKAGERVVTSGEFLIDSEASLKAALQRLASPESGE
ncbi:MAG TPA: efflux RND transporter periplasmic adaptor subunit [Gammaproteobacteria bacterium]|nr:efflux RND transporter periplasmic adaptor subunit [Gammaproteobacteria bacterium]